MTCQPDRTLRPGARVIDGRGTGTVRSNTGLHGAIRGNGRGSNSMAPAG